METQSFGEKVKRTSRKIVKIIVITAVIIGVLLLTVMYWATNEEGVMAGKILRISEKGVIFKTFEGKINLETFGALRGASPIAESFDFSVEKGDGTVIKDLEEVALSGERVNLHFIKRYVAFPWRGDTKYFATRVERLGHTPTR